MAAAPAGTVMGETRSPTVSDAAGQVGAGLVTDVATDAITSGFAFGFAIVTARSRAAPGVRPCTDPLSVSGAPCSSSEPDAAMAIPVPAVMTATVTRAVLSLRWEGM